MNPFFCSPAETDLSQIDRIFMSHYHSREHGFPLLESIDGPDIDDFNRARTVDARQSIRPEV